MSSCLSNLPPEIFEKIIKYLAKVDRLNLSCTNKDSNKRLKPFLWRKLNIKWELLNTSLELLPKCLNNLEYTKSITFQSEISTCIGNGSCDHNEKECLKSVDLKKVVDQIMKITCENLLSLQCKEYSCSFVSQYLLEHMFNKFFNLQNICLHGLKFIDKYSLNGIENVISLKTLSLIECSLMPSDMKNISKQTSLRTLNLNVCKFPEAFQKKDFEILQSLKLLETLQLREWNFVDDATMEFIAENFKHLRRLDVSNCFQISDAGVKNVTKLLKLESFEICFNKKITAASMVYLETISDKIKRLGLSETSWTKSLPAYLEGCQTLKHLNCLNSPEIDLSSICKFGRTLETLSMHDCELFLQRRYFREICNLVNLRKLDICTNGIDDHLLLVSRFEKLVNLEVLDIGENEISDEGIAILSSLPLLRILSVQDNEEVTDECESSLIYFPSLKYFFMAGTSIVYSEKRIVKNDNLELINFMEDDYVDHEYLYDVETFDC